MGVSLNNTNTEWIITTTKYGIVSCNVFFHCYDTRVRLCELLLCNNDVMYIKVTMEFNRLQDNLILFGVHQLEPVNVELSVTITSPAMKVILQY